MSGVNRSGPSSAARKSPQRAHLWTVLRGPDARCALSVLGAFLVAGVLIGVAWERIASPIRVVVVGGQLHHLVDWRATFDPTAVFVLLTGGAGLVVGIGCAVLGRRRAMATSIGVVVGGLAAAPAAYWVGRALGPGAPDPTGVADGATVSLQLGLRGIDFGSPFVPWPDPTLFVFALGAVLGLLGVIMAWPSRGERPTPMAPAQPSDELTSPENDQLDRKASDYRPVLGNVGTSRRDSTSELT